jgi:hypothetical protein
MLGLYRDVYRGFTVKHFHEQLGKRHNYTLGYTVTQLHLHRAGLVTPARSRSAHRKKRPRRPMVGMMLHQDASTHAWLPGDDRHYDLVATMDDATSAIYSLFLVEQEGTTSSLRGVREVIGTHGRPARGPFVFRAMHRYQTRECTGAISFTQTCRATTPVATTRSTTFLAYDQSSGRLKRSSVSRRRRERTSNASKHSKKRGTMIASSLSDDGPPAEFTAMRFRGLLRGGTTEKLEQRTD